MPGDDDNNAAQNNDVALKLPTFWAHQPRVSFAQAEAQFTLCAITVDSTKYSYLIAALPKDVATRALDSIESMADSYSTEKYKGLKGRLLGTFTPSDYERAGMLINGLDLGDDKPSALMDRMLALLGDHEPCLLFKRLFLQRLPAEVRAPLLQSSEKNMRKLAEQADLTWQGLKGAQNLLTNAVSELEETEVNRVVRGKSNPRTKDNPRAKDNPFQAWKEKWHQVPGGPCAYHSYYGTKARSCIPPCSAVRSGNASAGRQ